MPKETPTPTDEPLDLNKPATLADLIQLLTASSGAGNEALVKAFSEAMRQNAPRKKITMGEYDPKTYWHPKASEAHTLTRVCFQCGFLINPLQISNAEIDLLNKIDRSGRYIDRLVEVILREDGAEDVVEIRYRNKTADQRMENARHWHSLEHLLTQIVKAQETAEAELIAAGRPATRRRRPYVESEASSSILMP